MLTSSAAVCRRPRCRGRSRLATAIATPQLSLLEPVLHGGEKALALAVVAIWSLTINLPVPEIVRSRVSFDSSTFRLGFPLPWGGKKNIETSDVKQELQPKLVNDRHEPIVVRQMQTNLARMTLAALAVMQPTALVAPFVSAVDDANRRLFETSFFSGLQTIPDDAPPPSAVNPSMFDNVMNALTSPFRLFRPTAPRTIAMTSPLLPNSEPEQPSTTNDDSFVRSSVAMVTLAAAAMKPAALLNMLRSRSLSSPADEERVATATYSAVGESLLTRLRSILPQLTLPLIGMFDHWRFELPQFDLPRFVGRIRMAVTVHNASGLNHEKTHPFKLNGLRWHHRAISKHLRALEKRAAAGASGAELETAYSFVFAKIWRTYNNLERDIFFPWLVQGTDGDVHVQRAVNEFTAERSRIERAAGRVRAALRTEAQNDSIHEPQQKYAAVSNVRRQLLARELRGLAADVEGLHKAEQDVLFPIIAARFSVSEQRKLTNRMVDAMENRLSRLQLVNYFETIKNDPVQVAHFKDEVPAPLRALLAFWKMSYYDGTPLDSLTAGQ